MNWIEKKIYSAGALGFFRWMPDEQYLRLIYRVTLQKELDLDHPVTFNEKLQWLKIHDRRPEYTCMADKYAAKKYAANRIGNQYIIPTLGAWERFQDIEFDHLPDQFILKCTHDSGGLAICKDKRSFDVNAARKKINQCLRKNYYWQGREWPYKNIPRRIMCEKYMTDGETAEVGLDDYKLHCFNGEPKVTLVCSKRFSAEGLREDFFDEDWKHIPVQRPNRPNLEMSVPKPVQFEELKALARELAKNIPFVRTDFYIVNNQVYFGEMTFYPASGFESFVPEEWDRTFGSWIQLPERG